MGKIEIRRFSVEILLENKIIQIISPCHCMVGCCILAMDF